MAIAQNMTEETASSTSPKEPTPFSEVARLYHEGKPLPPEWQGEFNRMYSYFYTDPNQQMAQDSAWMKDPKKAQALYDSWAGQTAKDAEGGGLGGALSNIWGAIRDPLEEAAVLAGNFFVPGSSALTSKLTSKDAQEQLGSGIGKLAQAGTSLYGGFNPEAGVSGLESLGLPTEMASSVSDAAHSYLAKALGSPAALATEAGKSILANTLNYTIRNGKLPDSLSDVADPEQIAKAMAINIAGGASTAGMGSGLQSLGMAPGTATKLANAGLTTLRGGDPTSALIGTGLSALDVPGGAAKYLQPALTGLVKGNAQGLKNTLLSSAVDSIQQPALKELGWNKKEPGPLGWARDAGIRAVSGAARNALNKAVN